MVDGKNIFTHIVIIGMLGCAFLLSKQIVDTSAKADAYQQRVDQYEKDIAELEQQRAEIEALSEYVKSDRYVEDMAREKLGLVYKNEIIFEAEEEE